MRRILVVDDEPDLRKLVIEELHEHGYLADGVADGVQAVLKVLETRYDFVLLDIKLPRLDGLNALRIIKKIDPDLPVITFTGHAGRGEMAESVRLGAVTCLLKPLQMTRIVEIVERFSTP